MVVGWYAVDERPRIKGGEVNNRAPAGTRHPTPRRYVDWNSTGIIRTCGVAFNRQHGVVVTCSIHLEFSGVAGGAGVDGEYALPGAFVNCCTVHRNGYIHN